MRLMIEEVLGAKYCFQHGGEDHPFGVSGQEICCDADAR